VLKKLITIALEVLLSLVLVLVIGHRISSFAQVRVPVGGVNPTYVGLDCCKTAPSVDALWQTYRDSAECGTNCCVTWCSCIAPPPCSTWGYQDNCDFGNGCDNCGTWEGC
jgi:hypothetical protein